MKVLVVGSFRDHDDSNRDSFRAACRALGDSLARNKHQVILCSTSESTADRYVLEGIEQAEVKSKSKIIFFRLDQNRADPGADQVTEELFNSLDHVDIDQRYVDGGWRVAHLHAINEASLIISVAGGARGTGTIIYSAEAVEKPVIVVPIFGGASADAWRDFRRFYNVEEVSSLQRPWRAGSNWADQLLEMAVGFARRNPVASFRTSTAVVSVVISVILVMGWLVALLRVDAKGMIPPLAWVYILIFIATYLGLMFRHSLSGDRYDARHRLHDLFQSVLISFAILVFAEGVNVFVSNRGLLLEGGDARLAGWRLSIVGLSAGILLDEYIKAIEVKARKVIAK